MTNRLSRVLGEVEVGNKIFAPQMGPYRWSNVEKRQVYSAPFFELDPTAIDDLVVYFRNKAIAPLEIFAINLIAFTAGGVQLIQKVTGTAGGGGTTRVCVNMDLGSSETYAENIEFVTDPDITGLTEVATIDTFGQIAGEENTHFYPSGIILRQDNAIAISVAVATTILSGNLFFHVLPEEALN